MRTTVARLRIAQIMAGMSKHSMSRVRLDVDDRLLVIRSNTVLHWPGGPVLAWFEEPSRDAVESMIYASRYFLARTVATDVLGRLVEVASYRQAGRFRVQIAPLSAGMRILDF